MNLFICYLNSNYHEPPKSIGPLSLQIDRNFSKVAHEILVKFCERNVSTKGINKLQFVSIL